MNHFEFTNEWLDGIFKKFKTTPEVADALRAFLNGQYLALEGKNEVLHYLIYVFDPMVMEMVLKKLVEYRDKNLIEEKRLLYELNHQVECNSPFHLNLIAREHDFRGVEEALRNAGTLTPDSELERKYGNTKLIAGLIMLLNSKGYFKKRDPEGHKITKARVIEYFKNRYKLRSTDAFYRKINENMDLARFKYPIISEIERNRTVLINSNNSKKNELHSTD